MQPQEVLRSAVEIIRKTGLCKEGNAADANGHEVNLYAPSIAGDSRATINPNAVSFSIYGAIVKAMADGGEPVARVGLMWDCLHKLAVGLDIGAPGGTNYVHPVLLFNAHEDVDADRACDLLEKAAAEMEATMKVMA